MTNTMDILLPRVCGAMTDSLTISESELQRVMEGVDIEFTTIPTEQHPFGPNAADYAMRKLLADNMKWVNGDGRRVNLRETAKDYIRKSFTKGVLQDPGCDLFNLHTHIIEAEPDEQTKLLERMYRELGKGTSLEAYEGLMNGKTIEELKNEGVGTIAANHSSDNTALYVAGAAAAALIGGAVSASDDNKQQQEAQMRGQEPKKGLSFRTVALCVVGVVLAGFAGRELWKRSGKQSQQQVES